MAPKRKPDEDQTEEEFTPMNEALKWIWSSKNIGKSSSLLYRVALVVLVFQTYDYAKATKTNLDRIPGLIQRVDRIERELIKKGILSKVDTVASDPTLSDQ